MTQDQSDPPTFASVLDQLREARGLSQAQLARALNVYDGNVSRWRRGRGIDLENVRKIADFFGVQRSWLEGLAFGNDSDHAPVIEDDPHQTASVAQIVSYAGEISPEYGPIFWRTVTAQAGTLAASLQQISQTAISTPAHPAISERDGNSDRRAKGRRKGRGGSLNDSLPTLRRMVAGSRRTMVSLPAILSDWLGLSPSRPLAA